MFESNVCFLCLLRSEYIGGGFEALMTVVAVVIVVTVVAVVTSDSSGSSDNSDTAHITNLQTDVPLCK